MGGDGVVDGRKLVILGKKKVEVSIYRTFTWFGERGVVWYARCHVQTLGQISEVDVEGLVSRSRIILVSQRVWYYLVNCCPSRREHSEAANLLLSKMHARST